MLLLICRRIEGSHNYTNIAKCISDILTSYKIDVTKLSHTVTDNATNFGINKLIDEIDQSAENISEPDSEFMQNYMENDPADNVEVVINVSDILSSYEDTDKGNNDNEDSDIVLSNPMTCSAHTLNLVATTDTTKIIDLNYKKISRSAFGKLTSFKRQNI
ncbi:uncharacterized protein LOC126554273 [Aphis gossypii]|uniref:uncharacterized protein LOC126554273 n=1 Tax=Aphis gossypii TaxID=80765 RepID=UPI0021594E0C|nr:uncharacterized protein LOC126554273 [Aphis gossypii]